MRTAANVSEPRRRAAARAVRACERGGVRLEQGDSLSLCSSWPAPVAIISDGPYGISGYEGDLATTDGLAAWYEPHAAAWAKAALPETTLWFWNTELGWATVHPVLERHGWSYRGACVWDKGIGHLAGNVNTGTLRRVPPVTELCVQYTRAVRLPSQGQELPLKEWLRTEWLRSGLPLAAANQACGVKNAATRKYFTRCHLWYFPPPEAFARLAEYANRHGRRDGRPYFSIDGRQPLDAEQWRRMRAKFTLEHGVTNVWREPPVRGGERLKRGGRAVHSNQKPLRLIELVLRLSTEAEDMVWEPFAGVGTVAVAAHHMNRRCRSAELDPRFYDVAAARLMQESVDRR